MTRLIAASLLTVSLALGACGSGTAASNTDTVNTTNNTNGGDTSASDVTADKDVKIVNQPGVLIALEKVLVPGKVTVVDFFADWCGACKVIEKKLITRVKGEKGIAIRKIDIKDDESPVAKHYDVGALPHVRIYDKSGKMLYALTGNQALRAGELALKVRSGEQPAK